jgi:hypothetical protein
VPGRRHLSSTAWARFAARREGRTSSRFAAGITDTSFTLIRGASGTAEQDALVRDFGAGHSLTLADGLRVAGTQFRFDDGRAWTQAELLDRHWSAPLTLSATAADRVLSGGAGADVLAAAADHHNSSATAATMRSTAVPQRIVSTVVPAPTR